MNYFFEILRYLTLLWDSAARLWTWYWSPMDSGPVRRYFLADSNHTFDYSTYKVVPEGSVYVEEWLNDVGVWRNRVFYGGEAIPTSWETSPFDTEAKCPWVWVGDRSTEIDLTRTFNRFLVVGNRITMDLVKKLIRVTDDTDLIYIDRLTFDDHEFPGAGIVIAAHE